MEQKSIEILQIANLDQIEGVEVDSVYFDKLRPVLINTVSSLASLAATPIGIPIAGAFFTAAASLISSSKASCTRRVPHADINITTDSNGDLILRCEHHPPHEWDRNGNQM